MPPPPFEHEAAVVGLEWWLGEHMALASELAWLEQLLEGGPAVDAHMETLRGLEGLAGSVRDALYELYCDAADERLAPLVPAASVLEGQVRTSYVWCRQAVAMLGSIAGGLRSPAGPDWSSVKTSFREVDGRYPGRSEALVPALRALGIDTASPIEPLRNLPRDVEALMLASEALQSALARRFG